MYLFMYPLRDLYYTYVIILWLSKYSNSTYTVINEVLNATVFIGVQITVFT